MHEFVFADESARPDAAPVILALDTEELRRSYGWPRPGLASAADAAAELAAAIARQFGRRVGYKERGGQDWLLTEPPAKPSRRRPATGTVERNPSDEVYELKLARANECAFRDLPVVGTIDVGAYKRYGYDDGPAAGLTAKSCAVALVELFGRSVAYRPEGAQGEWLVHGEAEYFTPFDDETAGSLIREPGGGLYRIYRLKDAG